jgi:hypothetical protein
LLKREIPIGIMAVLQLPGTIIPCLEQWVDLFGRPDLGSAAEAWREFVEGPIEEERENARRVTAARRTGSPWNRPAGWVELTRSRTLAVAAGESPPGVG